MKITLNSAGLDHLMCLYRETVGADLSCTSPIYRPRFSSTNFPNAPQKMPLLPTWLPVNYSGCPQLPRVLIGTLSIIERIQANAKRLQLEAGHLLIDLLRNIVNARRQALTGLEKIASAQRLVGKTQVHHCCRASLRGNLTD